MCVWFCCMSHSNELVQIWYNYIFLPNPNILVSVVRALTFQRRPWVVAARTCRGVTFSAKITATLGFHWPVPGTRLGNDRADYSAILAVCIAGEKKKQITINQSKFWNFFDLINLFKLILKWATTTKKQQPGKNKQISRSTHAERAQIIIIVWYN